MNETETACTCTSLIIITISFFQVWHAAYKVQFWWPWAPCTITGLYRLTGCRRCWLTETSLGAQNSDASYRLEDSVEPMPYIALTRATGSTASWSLIIWKCSGTLSEPLTFDPHNRLIGYAVQSQQYLQSTQRLGPQLVSPQPESNWNSRSPIQALTEPKLA